MYIYAVPQSLCLFNLPLPNVPPWYGWPQKYPSLSPKNTPEHLHQKYPSVYPKKYTSVTQKYPSLSAKNTPQYTPKIPLSNPKIPRIIYQKYPSVYHKNTLQYLPKISFIISQKYFQYLPVDSYIYPIFFD